MPSLACAAPLVLHQCPGWVRHFDRTSPCFLLSTRWGNMDCRKTYLGEFVIFTLLLPKRIPPPERMVYLSLILSSLLSLPQPP